MRVHVVAKGAHNSDRIIPRLARQLAQGRDDWTLGEELDPAVDLNYLMVYLHGAGVEGWTHTPVGAWFSHYPTVPAKRKSYEAMAELVDLRTTSARQYTSRLRKYGLTRMVRPPIDLEQFTIRSSGRRAVRNIVGVVGYMSEKGRKGPSLVEQLANSQLTISTIRLRAAGKGWPIYCQAFPHSQMHEFYHGLQIFLCTSTTEGIPIPPLEALACGVKVVLPTGVGLLDNFKEQPGVRHYEAGNFKDMYRALERVLIDEVPEEELRSLVSRYTVKKWQVDHQKAFKAVLSG
jgi:glycosyltransferase involved in cell wall biosynthesis